jgi:2-polyprenyl-6-hydroxyphenyl methylase/3-demethylubiquinone-9 3-methyltransferase
MAEQYAHRGAHVTGIDISLPSLRAAARHAKAAGLQIDYLTSAAERLPLPDASFDAVVTADVLEHVADVHRVVAAASRVLRPEGKFVYDTVNRTWKSRLLLVWLPQNVFRIAPPDTHDYRKFVRPPDLHELMARHALTNVETRGLRLRRHPVAAAISYARTRRLGSFEVADDTGMSYVGYGVKNGAAFRR